MERGVQKCKLREYRIINVIFHIHNLVYLPLLMFTIQFYLPDNVKKCQLGLLMFVYAYRVTENNFVRILHDYCAGTGEII